MDERPGYFKDFNWELVNKTIDHERNKADCPDLVKFATTGQTYDVCSFGKMGTPINLETDMKVLDDFQDKIFKVKYNKIDAKA
jgi:carbonic anhydrase